MQYAVCLHKQELNQIKSGKKGIFNKTLLLKFLESVSLEYVKQET